MFQKQKRPRRAIAALALAGSLLGAGCTTNTTNEPIFDPYEAQNRKVHAFNKEIDRRFLSGGSSGLSKAIPQPVTRGLGNFASNLDQPGLVVNGLLQGNMEHALQNFWRGLVNTTVGIGGLFDPASKIGLTKKSTDAGLTLAKWGVREGAYLELPLLGPSSERDAAGQVIDYALNPLRQMFPADDRRAFTAARVLSKAGDRAQYSGTVESILYDSADSYAQARLLYLQNRRYEAGQAGAAATARRRHRPI